MKKRKLFTAFLMLMVTTISLVTASYAWFTANQTVSVAGLDVNVAASNGIQISTDAINWKPALTVADISTAAYVGNRNQLSGNLSPVSSAKTVTGGMLNVFSGGITVQEANNYLVMTQATDPTGSATVAAAAMSGQYIAFDVFVQSDKVQDLKLTAGSNVIMTTGSTDNGLKNSSRVAIINQGVSGTTAGAIALWGGTAASTFLWEPNVNEHTIPAMAAANGIYFPRTGGGVDATTVIASYDGVKAPITLLNTQGIGSVSTTYFEELTVQATEINLQTTTAPALQAGSYTITPLATGINKLRIYAWIEGQDVDCENGASGTNITFNIGLTIV